MIDISQEAEEERAAIKEYCGNITREQAIEQAARNYDKLRNCLAEDILKKPLHERRQFLQLFAENQKIATVEDLKDRMRKLDIVKNK